jgi:hypothetical protein
MKDEATTDYEYKVAKVEEGTWEVAAGAEAIEDTLNEETKGEWTYVDTVTVGTDNEPQVIFRRPA